MRVALALPLDAERRLADSAAYHGHEVAARCSGGDELALRLAQLPIELAVVAATPEHLTARLIESADLLGVRMLVVADDAEQARHASRVGIIDAVPGPADWGLLDGSPVAPAEPEDDQPAPPALGTADPRRPGTVVAVWGPHGAPGRTSVAIALAAEFAARGLRTVLADADTHAASVAPALGLLDEAPGFAAACRLAGVGGLDEAQLERLAVVPRGCRHPFRVLTGIGRAARWPELGQERVAGALAALRGYCEVLVVDIAASLEQDDELASDVATPRRNAAGLEVLRQADRVVALAAADPVGVPRFLRGHAELIDLVEPHRITVVATKVRSGAIGVNPGGQVRQTLARFGGIEDAALVPWDPAAFDAAVLGGRPLADAAPRSPARAAIRELAERLLPTAPAAGAGARRRLGRRLA
ncbi:MAG: regulator [Leifsonia xyli]|nr:MAG: regulator [Leifsonia xyli]